MRTVADDPRLTWVWNVYSDPSVVAWQTPPGAFIPSPRTSFADSNFAATSCNLPKAGELRKHGVCYRVVYRPFHPANARRNADRTLVEAELRRLARVRRCQDSGYPSRSRTPCSTGAPTSQPSTCPS